MATRDIIFAAAGAAGEATYVEDVFSTYLYSGNETARTIANGIDLSTKGGLVWCKSRNTVSTSWHNLFDTVRGDNKAIYSNQTSASVDYGAGTWSPATTGFNLGDTIGTGAPNRIGDNYVSWTFREQAKFFDIQQVTLGSSTNRQVAHNLASAPGVIIGKKTNGPSNWVVYHRSLGINKWLALQSTSAETSRTGTWGTTNPTATDFYFDETYFGSPGDIYIFYLFAHDAGGFGTTGTDNVISCGSFTTDANGNATINLGYEPQYLMYKSTSAAGSWIILDTMRGFCATNQSSNRLVAQSSSAESTGLGGSPSATGFYGDNANYFAASNTTYIYMAIRRPMKPPTSGTQVFAPVAFTGNNTANTPGQFITAGFTVDLAMQGFRNQPFGTAQTADRLRGFTGAGPCPRLLTYNTNAEANSFDLFGGDSNVGIRNYGHDPSYTMVNWLFRRAPGFFDQVCYTGDNVNNRVLAHNLTVTPELVIIKRRSSTGGWLVNSRQLLGDDYVSFNTTSASAGGGFLASNNATTFTISDGLPNASTITYVAYLFATLAGVSKVGSYTGTGGTQTINAALPTGARFVLIKRTDSTGNWWVWDTARGMVTSTDPRLALNSTAAEINNDWVYTVTNGFQIVTTDASVNASGGSYIYLAIA